MNTEVHWELREEEMNTHALEFRHFTYYRISHLSMQGRNGAEIKRQVVTIHSTRREGLRLHSKEDVILGVSVTSMINRSAMRLFGRMKAN